MSNLYKHWTEPEVDERLIPKQWSIRLPFLVAAQINAIMTMFPHKTKSEIISDLLQEKLYEFEQSLPYTKGEPTDREGFYFVTGPRQDFRNLTLQHLRESENDSGRKPMDYIATMVCPEDESEIILAGGKIHAAKK